MNSELQKILKSLGRLNDYANKSIVEIEGFIIEQRRLKDLDELEKETRGILSLLKSESLSDVNEIVEQVCYLDINIGLYAWHIENLKKITEKFIGLYRDRVFWKDVEYE